MRSLALHADDFGFNAAVTHGILAGFREGLLTSTSLLANAPAAELAIDQWRRLEELHRSGKLNSTGLRRRLSEPDLPFDLGIHLNLTQGRPLTRGRFPHGLLDTAGGFLPPGRLFLKLLTGGRRWRGAVEAELAAQLEWLIDRGLRPTHINGHQYVEMMPVVSELVLKLAHRYQVAYVRAAHEPGHLRTSLRPGMRLTNCCLSFVKHHYAARWSRALDASHITHSDAFFGPSHAGRIDINIMRRFLCHAQNCDKSEIAFHPGESRSDGAADHDSDGWHDPLASSRPQELRLLCSSELADLIATEGFTLGRLQEQVGKRWRAA
jgi:predicted glycoside hydrolase/deacetylase ChbG (UPF0249 family)